MEFLDAFLMEYFEESVYTGFFGRILDVIPGEIPGGVPEISGAIPGGISGGIHDELVREISSKRNP